MTSSYQWKSQTGLSLVELMIAIALGLFLTTGTISLFVNAKQSYRVQESLSRMQENGRFAMAFLVRDIRMADYSGCIKDSIGNAVNHLDTTHIDYNPSLHDFSQSIAGANGTEDAGNSALDASDNITIRTAFDSGVNIIPPYGPTASANVGISSGNPIQQADIVIISDCQQADIFQVSNATPSASGTIVHNTGNATSPGNVSASLGACPGANAHCLSKVYQGDASLFRLSTNAYTIENGQNGIPALFRNGLELVEGVDNMQILYGEDTNSDNTPNYYVPAGTVGLDMSQVVSIRISLLLSSFDDNLTTQAQSYTYNGGNVTPTDQRFRYVFTSTIAIRNRLP